MKKRRLRLSWTSAWSDLLSVDIRSCGKIGRLCRLHVEGASETGSTALATRVCAITLGVSEPLGQDWGDLTLIFLRLNISVSPPYTRPIGEIAHLHLSHALRYLNLSAASVALMMAIQCNAERLILPGHDNIASLYPLAAHRSRLKRQRF